MFNIVKNAVPHNINLLLILKSSRWNKSIKIAGYKPVLTRFIAYKKFNLYSKNMIGKEK